jgi:hypothetical protein
MSEGEVMIGVNSKEGFVCLEISHKLCKMTEGAS